MNSSVHRGVTEARAASTEHGVVDVDIRRSFRMQHRES